ncbi:MAG: DUF1904 family protein [Bdellovibrionota bacterium]
MPHIRLKCISEKNVKSLSKTLPKELARAMDTSEDNFSFELVPNTFYTNGKSTKSYPFIEVHWFERSQDIKVKSTKIITDQIKALTKAKDIVVVYIPIEKSDYFENEKNF